MKTARQLSGTQLADALRDSRARTLSLVEDLNDAQWKPPRQLGINPIAWELAHLAWFAEFWILRGPHQRNPQGFAQAHLPPRFFAPDPLFDSAQLAHAQRWSANLPSRTELPSMMAAQLQACIAAISANVDDDAALYFHRLALFHEDMHGEAFCWMRAALSFPAPESVAVPSVALSRPLHISACTSEVGYPAGAGGFAFDNEMAAHTVNIQALEIDSAPISAGAFLRFVEAGGYDQPDYWPGEAGQWRAQSGMNHPARWRKNGSAWQMRWFDQWLPLPEQMPVMHLNTFEAEAYCLWAQKRLPTAQEWEHAAKNHAEFSWGQSVWEWTSAPFLPYPGFAPGPYQEYSAPWFGNHRELRGGAFATHARMHDARYRNFFQPHRNDIFAGFRTVAL